MNKIIACIDGSPLSQDVSYAAAWTANKLNKPLLLLHTIEKNHIPMTEDLSGVIGLGAHSSLLHEMAALDEQRSKISLEVGKKILQHAHQLTLDKGCEHIEQIQRHGGIVEAITDLEPEARVIVIGRCDKKSLSSFSVVGSQIEQIIRQVRTPVLIASKNFREPKSFMLAYDGRETADKAVKRVLEGGLLHGLTCHLVSVKNNRSNLAEKLTQTETMLIEHGFKVKTSLLEGNIFRSLMEYKEKEGVGMLIMGAFSHAKLATVFLGSNTLKMIEKAKLPLLILH